MKQQHATPLPVAATCAALLFALLVAAQVARAQSSGGHRPRPTGSAPLAQPQTHGPSIRERQMVMGEMEKEAAKPPDERKPSLPLEQIAEDFERMQAVNNRMMAAVMRADAPDYRLVSDSTAEIRKRAARLKSNLSLPEPEEKEGGQAAEYKSPDTAAQLKTALLRLDRALMGFVKSPVFKNPDVVNADDAARARRDLEEVIELSRLLNKDAERLSKSAGKH
ncbi:MAG: hypothetical protein ACJ74T_21465 [Pyrinomonadaceae bacterium]